MTAKTTDAINSTNAQTATATALTGVLDTSSKWYGTYSGYLKPYPVLPDSLIISNGVAQLPYLDRQFSYSYIYYNIPDQHVINGDSVTLEAKVQNPKATSFSDYDVILQLVGDQHTAEVHFVADAAYAQYTDYYVGDARYDGLSQLVYYFGAFRTVKLAQKKYYTAVYINDTEVYKFKYGAINSIGRLKKIAMGFKGYGSCTQVGLKNSFSRQLIMSEDFNTTGQSHVLYY